MRFRLLLVLAVWLLALPGFAQPVERELVLAVSLKQAQLSEGITALAGKHPGTVLLPLGEICQLLGLGINVDPATGTAAGFFISENRRFLLDVPAGKVFVEGKPGRFDPTGIEVQPGEIYVSSGLLSEWFPVDLGVSLNELAVKVSPREALPVQKRLEREALIKTGLERGEKHYPALPVPYSLLDAPMLDQTLRLNLQTTPAGTTTGVQGETFLAGDFLYHSASLYLSANEKGIEDKRLSLGRSDAEGKLLGPLKATSYALGDVFYPGLDNVALPRAGAGLRVTNQPLGRQTQFDRNTFTGDLPSGWEVELYQNDSLISFRSSRSDGRYEFKDVPLPYGLNLFRLVFYGPQGQIRQELQRFNVDETLTPRGVFRYEAVGIDPGGRLERGHVAASYGLSKSLSATGSISSLALVDGQRQSYGSLGLMGNWQGLYLKADAVASSAGGTLVGAFLQGPLGPVGLAAYHAQLSNFRSEVYQTPYGLITSRSFLRLNASLPGRVSLNLSGGIQRDKTEQGADVIYADARISAGYRGTFLTNTISQRDTSTQGSLLLSKYVSGLSLRGEALYSVRPSLEVSTVTATAEKWIRGSLVSAGISRAIQGEQTHFLAGISRASKKLFSYGVSLDYVGRNQLTALLTVNTSLVRNPLTGRVLAYGSPLAGNGAVAAKTSLNGKPVEGVAFTGNGTEATGPDGTALLTGLTASQPTDLAVSLASIPDPSLSPAIEGVRLIPRSGKVAVLNVPLLMSGEVSGTVYVDGVARSGLDLELIGENKSISKVRNGYDGWYYFSRVPPGRYTLRIDSVQLDKLGLQQTKPVEVLIDATGSSLDGVNVTLDGIKGTKH